MPASLTGPTKDPWWNYGSKHIRTGVSRGTSTSSGVFVIETGFPREVEFCLAYYEGGGFRNSAADPAATTGMGTFVDFTPITLNTSNPTRARFRVIRDRTLSAASAVTTLSRARTLATSITGITARWFAVGY